MLNNKKSLIIVIIILVLVPTFNIQALTKEELQSSIAAHNLEIEKLEKEIAEYETKLNKTQADKQTLANAVTKLDITRKKLTSEINLTQKKITTTEFNISKTEADIDVTKKNIDKRLDNLSDSMRLIQEQNESSLIEVILRGDSLSDSLNNVDTLKRVQVDLRKNLEEFKSEKNSLETSLSDLDKSKKNLTTLHTTLSDKKNIADLTRTEKAKLLADTKNQESQYQKILADRKKQIEEYEAELLAYQSQLAALDPSQIPTAALGILGWPTRDVKINQYFGDTSFSRNNPQIYKGRGHSGVDFKASIGTEMIATADGTIMGTGNTDFGCPGASWGKWIMIKHNNGLSSVYGHLSKINVLVGQNVKKGEVIGYSGETGNSVGPHLHLSVLASAGVRIGRLTKQNGRPSACGEMPLSPLNGYLNPLAYMKSINPATNRPY